MADDELGEKKKMHVMSDVHIDGMVAMVVAAEAVAAGLNVPVSTALRLYLKGQQAYAKAINESSGEAVGAATFDLLTMAAHGKKQ